MIVLEVLGVGLWSVLGLAGAGWLLTGRKTIYGLPKGLKEGWPLRVMGLAMSQSGPQTMRRQRAAGDNGLPKTLDAPKAARA